MIPQRIQWMGADGVARHGEVWSPGPLDATVWVIPDEPAVGEGPAVCVGTDGRQTKRHSLWSTRQHQDLVCIDLASPQSRKDRQA